VPACCRDVVRGEQPTRLQRLSPPGVPATIAEIVEELGLWQRGPAPAGRPRTLLNMVSTVDGRASLQGRSAPLSGSADRALFHGLRAAVDAVLVGAGTARAERYGRIIPSEAVRRLRLRRGLREEPLACIVSGSLALGGEIPLLAEPAARVALLTPSRATLPAGGAQLAYVRARQQGSLDLRAALRELRERFDVRTVLCEGGPHLAAQLLAAGLVDELFLTLSPLLAAGPQDGAQAPRILAGAELEPPAPLRLLGVLGSDSQLFLRYEVSARERVSRETMLSSSLAR